MSKKYKSGMTVLSDGSAFVKQRIPSPKEVGGRSTLSDGLEDARRRARAISGVPKKRTKKKGLWAWIKRNL